MKFTLKLDPRAIHDIQEAIDYQDENSATVNKIFVCVNSMNRLKFSNNG